MKHKKGIICFMAMAVFVKWKEMKDKKRDEMLRTENNKLLDNYQLLNHWLEIKNEGKSLRDYFVMMEFRRIAIYGMAELANWREAGLKSYMVLTEMPDVLFRELPKFILRKNISFRMLTQ